VTIQDVSQFYRDMRKGLAMIRFELVDKVHEEFTYGQCWPMFYAIEIQFQTGDPRVIASTLLHEFIHLDCEIRDEGQVRYAQNLVDEHLWGQGTLDLLILGHTRTEKWRN